MKWPLIVLTHLLLTFMIQAQNMKDVQKTTFIKGVAIQKIHDCSAEETPKSSEISMGKFKVVKGKKYSGQMVESYFSTSPEGKFLLELKPGTYSIVEADRPEEYSGKQKEGKYEWNTLCLDSKWSEPLLTFTIGISDPIEVELLINRFN